MRNRTAAPPGASARLTDDDRKELSRRVGEINKCSEQGRGGGQG
jgi:hypothetical protein